MSHYCYYSSSDNTWFSKLLTKNSVVIDNDNHNDRGVEMASVARRLYTLRFMELPYTEEALADGERFLPQPNDYHSC